MDRLTIRIVSSLSEVRAEAWDALLPDHYPFLKHAFLAALERCGCLQNTGWHPQHFLLEDQTGHLLAAAPAYLKTNSFGEFVFDGIWASAYENAALNYYPKLVLAAPFTPATGSRLLVSAPVDDPTAVRKLLIEAIQHYVEQHQLSGAHCLFPTDTEKDLLSSTAWLPRLDYQYHWNNQGYTRFEDFLSRFRSHQRKNVRRERAYIQKQNITVEIRCGDTLSEQEWHIAHSFYCATFEKKGNYPALTVEFFQTLGQTMGKQIVVMFAYRSHKAIAATISFCSDTVLYGRYWGCHERVNNLHFELCFYQAIEYCIQNGLSRFEPGAQGEHKIPRGFLPTPTWSCHWIRAVQFRTAIAQFLNREHLSMQSYKQRLDALSPFRESHTENH